MTVSAPAPSTSSASTGNDRPRSRSATASDCRILTSSRRFPRTFPPDDCLKAAQPTTRRAFHWAMWSVPSPFFSSRPGGKYTTGVGMILLRNGCTYKDVQESMCFVRKSHRVRAFQSLVRTTSSAPRSPPSPWKRAGGADRTLLVTDEPLHNTAICFSPRGQRWGGAREQERELLCRAALVLTGC